MSQRQRWSASPPPENSWDEIPLVAQFQEQTLETYAVRDLHVGDIVAVPKARAIVESFPPTSQQPLRGFRVTRWSGYALTLAVLGGVGGISIGVAVSLAALFGLARFHGRVR